MYLSFLVFLVFTTSSSSSSSSCSTYTECVKCTEKKCSWTTITNECIDWKSDLISFEDQCPVKNVQGTSNFLETWMEQIIPLNPHLTLLDISLPGSHDSLSYDLSLRVSDGGIDSLTKLAALLHVSTSVIPDSLEDYMRMQGATQGLTVIQQLNSGIRFLDLRAMFEYTDDRKNAPPGSKWYSLHLLESNEIFLKYLQQIKTWIEAHKCEVVVLWISKHGSECSVGEEQYPKTSIEEKQQLWQQIEIMFKGMLLNSAVSSISSTPLKDLVLSNQRVIIYAADWSEFTNKSTFALNSCQITNLLGPGVANETSALQWETNLFASFAPTGQMRVEAKKDERFILMSLATGVPEAQMTYAALIKYVPGKNKEFEKKCTEAFHIPSLEHCPETLLDVSQLENYYKQLSLEQVAVHTFLNPSNSATTSWGFPNAIYINAVDFDGTIRTGTQVMWGKNRSTDVAHAVSAYAYSDSIVAYNLYLACMSSSRSACGVDLMKVLLQRRSKHPNLLWDDSTFGRLTNWPSENKESK